MRWRRRRRRARRPPGPSLNYLLPVIAFLVLLGMLLAMAEASLTRVTRVRAMSLVDEGRRGAQTLLRIEEDPPRFLNSVYLAVMIAQNGSAILVAILAEHHYANLGVTVASLVFTLGYFVFVEAMSKTFAVLHSDRVALALSPFVAGLSRLLHAPTRLLISLANLLLPGKGLRQGPFVTEAEILAMAEAGERAGAIEEEEKDLIHSIFAFGDTVVREVMTPRPDMVAIAQSATLADVQELVDRHGYSRLPVYRERRDDMMGVVHAKDVLSELRRVPPDSGIGEVVRPAVFVPESRPVAELMKDMRREQSHLALVVDEFGSVVGLVTLEDLLEEIVGEIMDEHDSEEPTVHRLGDGRYRVAGRLAVSELAELAEAELPDAGWDTVGGLLMGLLGRLPEAGDEVEVGGLRLAVEEMRGRRVHAVLVERSHAGGEGEGEHAAGGDHA